MPTGAVLFFYKDWLGLLYINNFHTYSFLETVRSWAQTRNQRNKKLSKFLEISGQ